MVMSPKRIGTAKNENNPGKEEIRHWDWNSDMFKKDDLTSSTLMTFDFVVIVPFHPGLKKCRNGWKLVGNYRRTCNCRFLDKPNQKRQEHHFSEVDHTLSLFSPLPFRISYTLTHVPVPSETQTYSWIHQEHETVKRFCGWALNAVAIITTYSVPN